MTKIKVFAFINSGKGSDWVIGLAIDEHGVCVAQHLSSSNDFSRYDMGATDACAMHYSDYVDRYGADGFEVVWVDDPKGHAGLMAAYAKNQERGRAAKETP